MTNVIHDVKKVDEEARRRVYAGDLLVLSPTSHSLELCQLADDMLSEAFAPHDPEVAQHEFPVEKYAGILSKLKPAFIHHPRCKEIIPKILEEAGCEQGKTYFDVPRLRTSTSDDYLTSGIAYAFHPHRDTWYSAPMCQINWWMPVRPITIGNGMAFYPRYYDEVVKNGSRNYNYYRWNKESRASAANHIGKDTREQPKPEQPLELEPDLRVVTPPGGIVVFAAAQLHASVENHSGRTRLSIDFRTVDEDDVKNRVGARNIDSECTGTTMRDYLRCTDLEHLPDELVALYDTEEPDADAITVYDPAAGR